MLSEYMSSTSPENGTRRVPNEEVMHGATRPTSAVIVSTGDERSFALVCLRSIAFEARKDVA